MNGTEYKGHTLLPYILKPLNAELYPICHLLALLGAHQILHVSRIRVNLQHQSQKHFATKVIFRLF